ncbi:hypothetical protein AAFF_G00369390 [Aldrovandia affinis]|uniref:C1q domain-containing protein n=1 Tax=Aldrovandia affinis TaxID=143900 RepID=A0AAD7WMR9_9TELE|nr:hypothetical protein AAFF_G00369390 [Aldrovandia affinis]
MFGFHKPKMYRSLDGCCICRAKSSSSRFTDSKRYEKDFQSCFGLREARSGEICNACVLLVKRWKKLPVGSKKNWNHVVDAREELKRHNSDAHSTTSSTSPAQSPSYSNQSDEGSDAELTPGSSRSPVFSFLDLTYWKRQRVCCGIIYKGRFGEVLIDPHLFKPCCRKKRQRQELEEEKAAAERRRKRRRMRRRRKIEKVERTGRARGRRAGSHPLVPKRRSRAREDRLFSVNVARQAPAFDQRQHHIFNTHINRDSCSIKPDRNIDMVRLSHSPILDASPPSECSEEAKGRQESPKAGSPSALSSLQLALSVSTTAYQGYDTYIEDGLICLKHKIRNIDKKRLKLEDYRKRMKDGETLNQDQTDAVEKYEEVLHNLAFAKELQKTLGALSQDLLRAQRKAVRREQTMRVEAEKRRLGMVLQVHYVLQNLQQEHVRKDFRSGLNHAPFLPTCELDHLLDLAALLGCKRNESVSLEDQMEQAAAVYCDLIEGRDKTVVGTTYKHVKEHLARLMDCGYFDHIPVPHSDCLEEAEELVTRKAEKLSKSSASIPDPSKLLTLTEVPTREFLNRRYLPETDFCGQGQSDKTQTSKLTCKADLMALKEQEPPDSWDMEFTDKPPSPQTANQKPWKGAATFVPKRWVALQRSDTEPKQRRGKSRGQQDAKSATKTETLVEMFSFPSSLPEDPVLRKRQLQDLMEQIQGSFCFMQDSVLDREGSPTKGQSRIFRSSPGPSSPIAQRDPLTSPVSSPSTALHSTPLAARPLPIDVSLTNGDPSLNGSDLDLTTDEVADAMKANIQPTESEGLPSPPLYCREFIPSTSLADDTPERALSPTVSHASVQSPCNGVANTPTLLTSPFSSPPSAHALSMATGPFQTVHTVFKVNAPLPPRSDLDLKSDTSAFSDSYSLSVATASTQTPPDFAPLDTDHLQPVTLYQSECPVSNGCQVYLSPGQTGGTLPRSSQPYYARGSVRGGYEGYRTGLQSPGGSFIPQAHREVTPVLYGVQDTGYQQGYKRGSATGGQRNHSRAAWSDSSQLSSPERDGETFTSVDSGHGDSRCITPIDVASQGPALMPVHVYPVHPPMRVAFSAARTVNFTPGTLDQTIVFDLLHSNLGETFDTHLGRFACPVDGTYAFFFHILKLATNVPLYVNLMRNEEVMVSAYANDGAPDHETASNHAVLQLYQGDRVWLRLHRGAIYGSSWKYSTFSGYLLYQD